MKDWPILRHIGDIFNFTIFDYMKMSLFNQMKLSMAKALQFSTDSNIFEIPECTKLITTDKISIKVANDTQMIKATVDYIEHHIANFNIRFLIRDERKNKKTIMYANLISGTVCYFIIS
ncbi:60S ribosomal protein [Dirofilaria immitis]